MAKVILIAMLSLLAVVHAAGWALSPAATDHDWAALAPGVALAAGGGLAVPDFKPLFPDSHDRTTASSFVSLVSVNRFDSVKRRFGGQMTLARAEWQAGASSSAVAKLGSNTVQMNPAWRWDRVAVLTTATSPLAQPRRPQGWRHTSARKFWPRRRPIHEAQVWLTLKQP